ncbi:MAG: tetratricopeptide repeat protein [Bacteroidota bacterium]
MMHPEGSNERNACEIGYEAIEYRQGSRQSQLLFDSALALNPNYAWAYYEKSVPYFKRGLLNEGILLLNKAIELDPSSYLTYRAYWFYQHKSFRACIDDLETFYNRDDSYLSYTPGGDLNMRIVLGMAYAEIGETQKAVESVLAGIEEYPAADFAGLYDYHALGVAYLKNAEFENAIVHLEKSVEHNPLFADTYFYLGEAHAELGDIEKAKSYYSESLNRFRGEVEGGYSGYSFCFPVSSVQVESRLDSKTL